MHTKYMLYYLLHIQDIHYKQSSPLKSPSPSPPNDPPPISTVQNSQDSCLYKHLQMLQLQQQQNNISNGCIIYY